MEHGSPPDIEHTLWIVLVEDSEHQWGRYAIGIASEVNADLKNKASIDLLTPVIPMTIKTQASAKSFRKRNNVSLLAGPSFRLDAQALTFCLLQIGKDSPLALRKFCVT
jgi:hypothetical protein